MLKSTVAKILIKNCSIRIRKKIYIKNTRILVKCKMLNAQFNNENETKYQ